MLIRCQKCRALFSLQDGVGGAGRSFKVECGRCLNRFDVSAAPRAGPEVRTPPLQTPLSAPPPPPPAAQEQKAAVSAEEMAKALKPLRPEDEQQALEEKRALLARTRRRTLRIALAVFGLAALVLGALGFHARFAGLPREAASRVERARELLLRDDTRSLVHATALFTEAARIASGEAMPEAERGFAMLLQAAAFQDLAVRLEKDPAASVERAAYLRESTRLLQHGSAAAKAALEEDGEDPVALRAVALASALASAPDNGALEKAARLAPQDAWVLYVKAVAQRKDPDAARTALSQARKAEPRLLRAQVELAGISADKQEPGPAREALAKVLQDNPSHDRAKRMLALLPNTPR